MKNSSSLSRLFALAAGCSDTSGRLRLGGSDTMDDVLKQWASAYATIHSGEKPSVHTQDAAFDSLMDVSKAGPTFPSTAAAFAKTKLQPS